MKKIKAHIKEELFRLDDKTIRREFIKRNLQFFKTEGNVLINEFGLSWTKGNGKNIADIAYFDFKNNLSYTFEIKSKFDNFSRLHKQLISYVKYFNIVYVICYSKQVEKLKEFLIERNFSNNVGVIEVDDNLNFKEVKKAIYSKPSFDFFIRNLDKEELVLLCETKGINSSGSKIKLIDKIKLKVSYEELFKGLKNKLRRYYIKECEKCKSRIYFKRTIMNRSECFCFECGSIILDY